VSDAVRCAAFGGLFDSECRSLRIAGLAPQTLSVKESVARRYCIQVPALSGVRLRSLDGQPAGAHLRDRHQGVALICYEDTTPDSQRPQSRRASRLDAASRKAQFVLSRIVPTSPIM
jgi:hypothetical protein